MTIKIKNICIFGLITYFCTASDKKIRHIGELAHLARALDWQSKGDGFDPRILHQIF